MWFNFNIIGILFVIFNLIGVYQLIALIKVTEKEIGFGIKSLLFNKEEKNYTNQCFDATVNYTNYYLKRTENQTFQKFYEIESYKTIPDFNLLFLSSIIGNIFLKVYGFKISSIIFLFINSGIIYLYKIYIFQIYMIYMILPN